MVIKWSLYAAWKHFCLNQNFKNYGMKRMEIAHPLILVGSVN
jgi:hypothetical protein